MKGERIIIYCNEELYDRFYKTKRKLEKIFRRSINNKEFLEYMLDVLDGKAIRFAKLESY